MSIKEQEHKNTTSEHGPADPSRRKLLASAAGLGLAAGAVSLSSLASASEHKEAQPREFEGRSAFITGAARGIGYACAEALARGGANVVLFDIASQIKEVPYPLATEEDLLTAKSTIESLGVKCIAVKGDVRDGDAQAAAMKRARYWSLMGSASGRATVRGLRCTPLSRYS